MSCCAVPHSALTLDYRRETTARNAANRIDEESKVWLAASQSRGHGPFGQSVLSAEKKLSPFLTSSIRPNLFLAGTVLPFHLFCCLLLYIFYSFDTSFCMVIVTNCVTKTFLIGRDSSLA